MDGKARKQIKPVKGKKGKVKDTKKYRVEGVEV